MERQTPTTARLNPAAKAFIPTQQPQGHQRQRTSIEEDLYLIQDEMNKASKLSSDAIFSPDVPTAPSTRPEETNTSADIASGPNEPEIVAAQNKERLATLKKKIQDLWTQYTKLEKSLEMMQIAGENMLAYKSMVEIDVTSEGAELDCEELFKRFRKALEEQTKMSDECRTGLEQANALLTALGAEVEQKSFL